MMSALFCFINDRFIEADKAALPVHDLGVQRGYGIFDFLRVTEGVPLFVDDHLERFYNSAKEMRLPVQQSKEALKAIIINLLEKNKLRDAGVRILLSGGSSPDGYQIIQPNLAIIQQPLTPPATQLIKPYKLVSYPHQRQMPNIKTTDYLMAVWLQPWVKENGADDVLYHQNNLVSECPRSNFFIVTEDDRLVTPEKNILKGVTRKQLLSIAPNLGITVEERPVSLEDVRKAKEAFISSSTKRLIPVRQVDDTIFAPLTADSVTARLFNAFKEWELSAIHSFK